MAGKAAGRERHALGRRLLVCRTRSGCQEHFNSTFCVGCHILLCSGLPEWRAATIAVGSSCRAGHCFSRQPHATVGCTDAVLAMQRTLYAVQGLVV